MERIAELLARLADLGEIPRDELDEILAELTDDALLDGLLDAGDLETLAKVAEAVDSVRAEATRRDEEAEAAAAEAAALLERIRGSQADPDADPETPDPDEADDPAEEPAPDEAPSTPEAQVPVAAAAAPVPARLPSQVRRPAAAQTRPRAADAAFAALGLTASANNGSVDTGHRFTSIVDFANALTDATNYARGYRGGGEEYARLASMVRPASAFQDVEGRDMHLGMDSQANHEVMSRAQTALTAAGGICLPLPAADLGLPTLGSTERPIANRAMQRFGATAGGIRTIPSPTLADVSAASPAGVSVWTEPIDTAWTGTTPNDQTKPCAEVDCPTEVETVVDAIVSCLLYSNFRGRFNPTQIDAWMRLLGVVAARFSENRLLTALTAGSTAVTGAAEVSALPDFITYNRQMMARFRYIHRLSADTPFTVVVPQWFIDYLVSDLVRRMPHDTNLEDLGGGNAVVEAILGRHNINLIPHLDGLAGQIFSAQAGGAINEYPTTVVEFIYPSGAWSFLDGGELNLGVVRDSTLNATNRVKYFAETFEAAHFRGPESLKATLTLVNKGTASALTAVTGG